MQKNNWKKCKLGDVAEITSSKRIFLADYVKEGVPFYRSKEIIERSSGRSITTPLFISEEKYEQIINKYGAPIAGDLLLTSVGTLGIPYRVSPTDKFYFKDGNLTWFRKLNNILCDYLYYFFLSPIGKEKLAFIAIGSTQKALTINALQGVTLSLPPLDEQKRIADILGAFDDKIELLQKQNKTLEDMAKALFKSLFVDFDVVRAKQKGLPKADIMREYHLTEELYDLFPSSFADSPLGPIPSGWEVKKAQEIADIAIGRTPPRKETKWFSTDSTDTTWISIKDLGNCGVFIGDSSEYLTEDAVSKFKIPMIPTKTVVLSFKLTVGRVAITMKEMCSNEAIAQFKDAMVPIEYLYLLLKHINFSLLGSTSSIATAINSNTIKNMNVLIADSVLLSAFKERTQNLFDKIEINLKQIQTLTELRDTLLPRLISGKIRV